MLTRFQWPVAGRIQAEVQNPSKKKYLKDFLERRETQRKSTKTITGSHVGVGGGGGIRETQVKHIDGLTKDVKT